MARRRRFTPAVEAALKEAGAVLVRERTHLVFRLRNGKTLVTSLSPSDRRASANVLRDLKKLTR